MKRFICLGFASLIMWLWPARVAPPTSDAREIDAPHSTMTVHVYKSGLFSALAHNHEIQAPIQSGQVKQDGDGAVELRVDARKLRVLDAEVSDETRTKIQETMLGSQVLDAEHFPEIHFQSFKLEQKGADHWTVQGNLTLHGKNHPVSVDVTLKGEHYLGSATLKQTDFGITPVVVAGGTVKVKDEVKIEFDIALNK